MRAQNSLAALAGAAKLDDTAEQLHTDSTAGKNSACEVPDYAEARRYLTLLDESAEHFAFRVFDDDAERSEQTKASHPRGKDPRARTYNGPFDNLAGILAKANADRCGVFVVANAGGQKKDAITRVRAVFADTDGAALEPIMACGLEPHFIVETSHGRWHVYWLVDGLPLDQFEAVQRAIAQRFGTDPSVHDLPRVMRLPGFDHHKGAPYRVRIIRESGGLPYSADTVLAEFPPMTVRPVAAASAQCTLPADGGGIVVDKGRHDDSLRFTARMARAVVDGGMGEAGAWGAIAAEADRGRWTRPMPELRREFDDALRKIRSGELPTTRLQNVARANSQAANDAVMPKITNASELLGRKFLPVQWAVQGILPEGVSILSGDPKIGKSWLLYQACIAVAAGHALWAGREPEIQGDTLMLALEDNDRRLQRRLETLLPRFTTIKGRQFVPPSVDRLHLATEWPRAEDGVSFLQQWLREHPACRLVVIDTVSAFRKKDIARNKGAYAADYEVGEMFKPLAREFSCAIVLVMHNRKQQSDDVLQMVSGTQGMTGGVDNVLVLRRERGKLDAGLYVDGRDIEEPQEIAMRFSDGYWSSDGQSVDDAKMSVERRAVLAVVAGLGDAAKVRAIADELSPKKYQSVKSLLSKMVHTGDLLLADGLYMCVGTVGTVGTREAA